MFGATCRPVGPHRKAPARRLSSGYQGCVAVVSWPPNRWSGAGRDAIIRPLPTASGAPSLDPGAARGGKPMAAPSRALPRIQPASATSGAWLLRLLLVLFFCSGISGLVYQVLWLRILSLVFGVTVFAVSTVLASFMAGLAVGSFGAGKLADRLRNPLAAYGVAEVLIGLTALVT